jgi:GTP-binding protein LepA
LIVDAAKAYRLNHFKFIFGLENDLEVIPILNKVDYKCDRRSDDIVDLLGCKLEEIIHASGKLV